MVVVEEIKEEKQIEKKRKKELTLEMLDGEITVGVVRLMREKRIKL